MNNSYLRNAFFTILVLISFSKLAAQNSEAKFKEADEYFSKQEFKLAIDAYVEALKIDPSKNSAWFKLASSYHSAGDYDNAIRIYKRLTPNGNTTVLYNLSCALSMQGNIDESLQYLEQAVQKGFNQINMLKQDTELTNVRSDARFEKIVGSIKTCDNTPEFHQFDFWVGEWDVFNPQNQKVGDSKIEKILKDCIILENWIGATGYEGKSFNHYDAEKNKWYQYWIDEKSNIINFEGEYSEKDKAMIFISYDHEKDASPFIRKLTFFSLNVNTVRQFSQLSSDEGETWSTEYDFTYKRKQ